MSDSHTLPTGRLLMSAPATSTPSPAFVPPPTYVSSPSVDPALGLLLVGTVGAALLVPITVSFCYACARVQPRSFFITCLSIVALGLAAGAVNIFVQTQAIQGWDPAHSVVDILVSLALAIPVAVQAALLVEIGTIHAWPAHPWTRRAGVLLPSFLLKLARIVLVVLCIINIPGNVQGRLPGGAPAAPWLALWNSAYSKPMWVLQLVDDLYSSAVLIIHARRGAMPYGDRSVQPWGNIQTAERILLRRFVSLSVAAGSSFAVPVLFGIAQLIFTCLPAADPRRANYAALYIVLGNVYVETISLLLVALWHPGPPSSAPHASPPLRAHSADTSSATHFLSPLPVHPRIEFSPASSGGSERDSATLHSDGDSTLGADAEKLKIMEVYPGARPQAAPMVLTRGGGWAYEPSVCSFNGSIQTDAQGEPVFYAV